MAINDTALGRGIMEITEKVVSIIITPVTWLITGAAIVLFFYGLTNFILNSEGTEKENGKRHMITGLLGLLIIFAVWGIIGIIGATIKSVR